MICRAAAKRCVAWLALVSILASSTGHAAEPRESPGGGRLGVYFDSGALAGNESTNLIVYSPVSVRFFAATGFQIRVFPQDSLVKRLESFGLEYSVAIGHQREDKWDVRHAVGPAVTWQLGEDWRLHDMIGAVWSSNARLFDRGYQMRNGIIYKTVVSFEIVWQSLPVATRDTRVGSGSVTSFYAGFALHGEPGVYFMLSAMAVVVISTIIGTRVSNSGWGD